MSEIKYDFNTVAELFKNTVDKYPNKELYYYKKGNDWSSLNGKTILYTVTDITNAIRKQGLVKNDKVGIISSNSPKWAMIDYGIICSGSATVSIYPTLISSQIEYIVNDSQLKILFLENEDQLDKVKEIWSSCPSLFLVVMMNDSFSEESEDILKFTTFLDLGMEYGRENPSSFEDSLSSIKEDDLLTLIYTSGTTGNPKGVMLTHKNLVSNIKATYRAQKFADNEVFLSFLPLSHVFERMCGHFSAFGIGAKTYYAESIERVADNMKDARPTILISVPRLYEKIHAKILSGLDNAPKLKKSIFNWSLKVGRKTVLNNRKTSLSTISKIKYLIAKKLIFSKVKDNFGGRIRNFISGGAPLSKELAEFFGSLELTILEGYGLTETSPIISCNRPDSYKFGTVGKPLDNVEVRIAEDGEILSRGPNIMSGYFNKDKETQEAIDQDGWFHTGDIGEIDSEGFLKITDRKKSLIVTSGGKNVAPAPIENAILNSVYVEQCIVVGDRRNFISCLIVPNFEALSNYLLKQDVDLSGNQAIAEHKKTLSLLDNVIDKAMENFSKFETVKKYRVLPNLWTLEKGELTPSLKTVRRIIEKNYKETIDSMYSSDN